MQTVLVVALWVLSVVVALFIGGFLKSYMAKKGENLATREDVQMLVDQMKAVTQATKEIEAKISNEVWDRQRRWELKRDVVFEMTKRISAAYDALATVYATYRVQQITANSGTVQNETIKAENQLRASTKWGDASTDFDTTVASVVLVCSPDLVKALRELMILTRRVAKDIPLDPDAYLKAMPEYLKKTEFIEAMMRKELGIDIPS